MDRNPTYWNLLVFTQSTEPKKLSHKIVLIPSLLITPANAPSVFGMHQLLIGVLAPPFILLTFACDTLFLLPQGLLGGVGAGAQGREVRLLEGGKVVGVDDGACLLQPVDSGIETGGYEEGSGLGFDQWREKGLRE